MIFEPLESNEECPTCGVDLGPSSSGEWHFEGDDCLSARPPLEGPTIIPVADE